MYIKKFIKPYKIQAILGFFFKLTEALLELLVPSVVALIIDNGVNKNNVNYINRMGIMLFILAILGYLCALVCQYFASLTSQGFGTLMRKEMYEAINLYDYDNLDEIGTPSLITRITGDVNQLQLAVAMTIRLASRSPFLIIGSIIASFLINVQLGLIVLCVSPFIGFAIYFILSRTQPIYRRIQKILDHISLLTRENLSGVRVIRAFNKEETEKDKFHDTTNTQKDYQIKAGKLSALLNPMTTIIVNAAIIFILYVSGIKINTGNLTQGEVIAVINYLNQILLSMYVFSNVILIYIKANTSYQRVSEVLDLKPSIISGDYKGNESYDDIITFEDVSFSYREADALSHLNFSIKPHQTIGIIGGTGSGKSTLVNLIPRFYDASSGTIKIKNKDIKEYSLESLREMIGIVPQKAVLFKGTIKDNLLWGNKNASDQEIEEALRLSQSYEFVSKMNDGINTKIEQGGRNVSGGQRQRLTIARALIKKPEILILDDSASALDFKTDALLRKAIRTLPSTNIIVSQRVSAIMHCDSIIVLTHGEIDSIGTHDELLNNSSLYREIVQSQMEDQDEK